MAEIRSILWRFLGDSKSLDKASKRGTKSLGTLQKAAGTLGVALGAGQLARGMGDAIARAEQMESQYATTRQIIEQTGSAAGLTEDDIRDLSREMSQVTGIDKAVTSEAANVLLTFKELKGVTGEMDAEFERALRLTGDMASVFGGSARDAAKQLGKALNDPIGQLGALSRVGVQFTASQKDAIKAMVELGDIAGAQNIMLDEMESQFGGAAEASADASDKIRVSVDEMKEAFGREFLTVLDDAANAIGDTDDASTDFGKAAGKAVLRVAGLSDAIEDMGVFSDDSASMLDKLKSGLNIASTTFTGAITDAAGFNKALRFTVETGNELKARLGELALETQEWRDAAWAAQGGASDLGGTLNNLQASLYGIRDAGYAAWKQIAQIPGIGDVEDAYLVSGRGGGGSHVSYDHAGGVVPGIAGTNQLRMLQAGETVIPRGGGGGGGGVQITVNMGVVGDPDAAAQAIADLMTRYETIDGTRRSGVV